MVPSVHFLYFDSQNLNRVTLSFEIGRIAHLLDQNSIF